MASLKEFRTRIASVQSTQKITAAMKMVSGAKLRRAEASAIKARPYAEHLRRILGYLLSRVSYLHSQPALLIGCSKVNSVLLMVFSSDRGLCGSFNAGMVRETHKIIKAYRKAGTCVQIICIGHKAADSLKGLADMNVLDVLTDGMLPQNAFHTAQTLMMRIISLLEAQEVGEVRLLYNHFHSAMRYTFTNLRLVPVEDAFASSEVLPAIPVMEPSEEEVLKHLLEHNIVLQIYQAMLESMASEQGARMTAMDSATRNAEDMLSRLKLHYNRTRQALITKELTEIVSGAEALGNG
ncbi:MAG: ATP synthase F1 subunit gamma [Holosporales bacterium]|jgi:F-type H+-transporting ATPase subunit gamma|nr:ATP synthase F1 subunit gamma [Holosporales bacterium]